MTMPPVEDGIHSLLGQVIGTQTEIKVQLAVISEQLRSIPDHEQRLRTLEAEAQQQTGGRDVLARVVAVGAGLAAIGGTVAQYVHK